MSVTREDDGGRDERVRIIEFWRAVEIFTPQPLPRPDARSRVTDAGPGEAMPWEPNSRHYQPPPPGKAWRHEVFGGVHDLGRVRDTLTSLYGPDSDDGQREPAGGHSALFAVTVDGDGGLVPGTAVLSSCAWAVGRALAAPGGLPLADFGQDAGQFARDLGGLVGADDEASGALLAPISGPARGEEPGGETGDAAGDAHGQPAADRPGALPGEPTDLKLRPVRGEDLRRLAARLADRLGVTEALRPRGLRVRGYLVDADRADEQTTPSFLNSFYADDLARAAAALADGDVGAGLAAYLTGTVLIDAGLGNAVNRQAFTERFWWGAPGRQDGCMVDLLGRATGRPVNWDTARDEFRAAQEKVKVLAAERMEVALAQARLPELRRDASVSYDSIIAAEDTLRALAGARVTAERSLRAACHRYQAAAKALDAHARAKPGLRTALSIRFGARQEWRARQGALDAALRDCAAHVNTAQRAIAEVRAGFAAAVHARAESVATLRRLTAECAAAQEVIARGRQRWGEHFPEGPEFLAAQAEADKGDQDVDAEARREVAAPWADPEFAAARTELFLAALALHKALITAQARRVRGT